MVYFKLKTSTTPINYFGIAKMPTYRNSSTALTAGILTAIDRCDSEVEFSEPTPIIEDMHANGINVGYSDVVGYEQGNLVIPEHPMKSGKWWYYVVGSCTTVSATFETHTLNEADSQPFLGIHGELEHATTAYNKMVDLVGVSLEYGRIAFGQTRPTMQSFRGRVAESISAGNLARSSALDHKRNFLPGKFSAVLEYGGTSLNYTIRGGYVESTKVFEYGKAADTLVTEANLQRREYAISLEGLAAPASSTNIFTVPGDPADYSSNTITLDLKIYRTKTSDFIRLSFNNLRLDKVMGVKIDERDYYWKGNLMLHNCGARTAVSSGKLIMTITDNLTKNHYER